MLFAVSVHAEHALLGFHLPEKLEFSAVPSSTLVALSPNDCHLKFSISRGPDAMQDAYSSSEKTHLKDQGA